MPEVKIRLTETVKAGGCASKLSPALLDQVLGKLPRQHDSNVLVGFDHADDAGVYRIAPDLAQRGASLRAAAGCGPGRTLQTVPAGCRWRR